jgi:hypothetical protein
MNGKKLFTIALGLFAAATANAQTDNGKKNIEKLCGCFSVNFKYAETFSPDPKYKYHDREEMNATELALPIETTDNKVVIQHLLVISDSMVIKHWREEWEYESPVLYSFAGNKEWKKNTLKPADVKGKWTQTIWEVNDEPRYQGISAWVNNNGKTYWESTVDAPLPRREYTMRSDYNILKRGNRLLLTDKGYTHIQDNEKIQRTDGKEQLIAEEKGYNTYMKMNDSECAVAKEWWKKNEAFWKVVRREWDQKIEGAETIHVKSKVEEKQLTDHFTALFTDWSNKKIKQEELPGKVKEVLAKFL